MKRQAEVTCPSCRRRFRGLFSIVESFGAGVVRADYDSGHDRVDCSRADESGGWLKSVNDQARLRLGGR